MRHSKALDSFNKDYLVLRKLLVSKRYSIADAKLYLTSIGKDVADNTILELTSQFEKRYSHTPDRELLAITKLFGKLGEDD